MAALWILSRIADQAGPFSIGGDIQLSMTLVAVKLCDVAPYHETLE